MKLASVVWQQGRRNALSSSSSLNPQPLSCAIGAPLAVHSSHQCRQQQQQQQRQRRCIHSSIPSAANPLVHPTVPGPPPKAPVPAASFADERIAKKRQQLEMVKQGRAAQPGAGKPATSLRKRFWKDVRVEDTPEGYHIYLDTRPVRKADKSILTIPHSKPHLATAIALEWDSLVMAQQALKQQYIPLTSLTSRAHDIAASDAAHGKDSSRPNQVRDSIVNMLMGYLRTDTLLCWAPEKSNYEEFAGTAEQTQAAGQASLRQTQEAAAKPIVAHLTSCVWPGVELHPALEDGSIVPRQQPDQTQAVVRGWLTGLPSWELAGLERAVLASKSLCVGARLIVEWSGAFKDVRQSWQQGDTQGLGSDATAAQTSKTPRRFAIEEAAEACSHEVAHQTRQWGEVEDTHDVDREDLRRQLGSAVLLVHNVS